MGTSDQQQPIDKTKIAKLEMQIRELLEELRYYRIDPGNDMTSDNLKIKRLEAAVKELDFEVRASNRIAELEAEVERLKESQTLNALADSGAFDDCFVKVGKKLWQHTKAEVERLTEALERIAGMPHADTCYALLSVGPHEAPDESGCRCQRLIARKALEGDA